MGLFTRIHRITVGRIVKFLERLEDPETVFPQLLREMQQQLDQAAGEEARAVAAVARAQRDVDKARQRITDLGRGAEMAVRQGDEDTAREALAAQIDTETGLEDAEENLSILQNTREYATSARKQIAEQLGELRAKRNEIITRSRVARSRKKIQRTVNGSAGSTTSILDAVARLEESVEQAEAELDIQARLVGENHLSPSLEERLAKLSDNHLVETRLQTVKAMVAVTSEADSGDGTE